MEILIISKSRGTTGQFRLGWFSLLLALLLIAGGTGYAAYAGYGRGSDDMAELIMNNPEQSAQIWQREIVLQRQYLNRLDREMDADLSALAGAMARVQAQLARLDAVAERVMISNKLDAEEFALGAEPPLGGPRDAIAQPPQWKTLFANLAAVKSEVTLREARLSTLEALLADRQLQDDTQLTGRPVREGWISSGFGYRTDPVTGEREFHSGLDFVSKPGAQIRAVAAGVVTWSGKRWGYGNMVEISHGNGYLTRYAHNRANLVALGDMVTKNQPVALVGSTGRTTGPHVHFEVVHNDETINPRSFIEAEAGG